MGDFGDFFEFFEHLFAAFDFDFGSLLAQVLALLGSIGGGGSGGL